MKLHDIKLNIKYAQAVLDGNKTFELRINDKGYQVGDLLSFHVVSDRGFDKFNLLDNKLYEITYVLNKYEDIIPPGWCIFSFTPLNRDQWNR